MAGAVEPIGVTQSVEVEAQLGPPVRGGQAVAGEAVDVR
jgi:hypothetical protein